MLTVVAVYPPTSFFQWAKSRFVGGFLDEEHNQMGGVMAGSAILSAREHRKTLGTVTLTINNVCNLTCPHCYLQYDGSESEIRSAVIDHVMDADFGRICIVGKEPLASKRSVKTVQEIVERGSRLGKEITLVTNGLNGHLLSEATLESLAWVDVSLDGGPATYEAYRGGSWEKLKRSCESMRTRGLRDLRILQTLSAQTIDSVEDMLEAVSILGASLVVFSPFQPTRTQGSQNVEAISPYTFVNTLKPFADDVRIHLSFDTGYSYGFEDTARAIATANEFFGNRFSFVENDPIDRGIVRVTYDGLVLTPFEAVNTEDYREVGRPVLARPLDSWFHEMLSSSRRTQPH